MFEIVCHEKLLRFVSEFIWFLSLSLERESRVELPLASRLSLDSRVDVLRSNLFSSKSESTMKHTCRCCLLRINESFHQGSRRHSTCLILASKFVLRSYLRITNDIQQLKPPKKVSLVLESIVNPAKSYLSLLSVRIAI